MLIKILGVNKHNSFIAILIVFQLHFSCTQQKESKSEEGTVLIQAPEELYEDLFFEVQGRTDLFPDSKTFVDAIPKREVKAILEDFNKLNDRSKHSMTTFLDHNFHIPGYEESNNIELIDNPSGHITRLWSMLTKPADPIQSGTLIPLKNPYVVPGGRFREVYYWDSYFTMLGLKENGKNDLIDNILANFSNLIDSMGFIPNGNRTYYNSRSQPPFYALMVSLSLQGNRNKSLVDYHDFLIKEYNFWMNGEDKLDSLNPEHRRVIRLGKNEVLNRYWDDKNTPRAESYREDIETVKEALEKYPNQTKEAAYRDLRAAAESGWDFSSRWFDIKEEDVFELSSIHTTDIIPVDLNSLLYYMEQLISRSFELQGMELERSEYHSKAINRKELIIKYCWNEDEGFFMDYDFKKKSQTSVLSLAGLYPLFFQIASEKQAKFVSTRVKEDFLKPGGVVTTFNNSGQQWDFPNGWAPLQWMTIKGLRNYNQTELSNEIKRRWLAINSKVFENTGKMTEKYNVIDLSLEGGGGEYPNQDGFGWTNGVFQKLYKEKM